MLLIPLAFESYGRWGKKAVLELKRLARRRAEREDAQNAVDPNSAYRGFLRRWRQEVAVTLQQGNFAIYSACARRLGDQGGTFHVAGAGDVSPVEAMTSC